MVSKTSLMYIESLV